MNSAKKKKKTGGRVAITIEADDQLGPIVAIAAYMKVGRTWLFALKKCATRIHEKDNPTPFRGGKTCQKWIMEWLERNPQFARSAEYQNQPQRRTP